MNKTAVRNFAVWARVQLLEAVKQRAFEYEIYENRESQPNLDCIGDKLLTKAEKQQRKQQAAEQKREARLAKLTPTQLAKKQARDARRQARADAAWEKELQAGERYYQKISAELAAKQE